MDIEIRAVDFIARIEDIIADCPGGTDRFDNLIELRDYAQALIDREKDRHEQALKAKAEQLRKQLAEHSARISTLDSQVRAARKTTRSDAGKPRVKKGAQELRADQKEG